jgi:hypothetical protein
MRKSVIGIGAAVVLATGAALAATAVAQADDGAGATDPAVAATQVQPKVEVASVIGSGCPSGIPGIGVSYNNGIQVTYGEMESVRAGGAGSATPVQENCQLNLRVDVPDGMTYAVSSASTSARVGLTKGAEARLEQAIYIQGVSDTNYVKKELAGPVNGMVNLAGSIAAKSFAPCGSERNLNINTRVVLNTSDVTVASANNNVSVAGGMKIALTFKKC